MFLLRKAQKEETVDFYSYSNVKTWSVSGFSRSHYFIESEVRVEERTLLIESLKNKSAERGDFLPHRISVMGKTEPVWTFQELKDLGFYGLAKLFRLLSKGQPDIDLIGLVRGRTLLSVIPLSVLGKGRVEKTEAHGIICRDESFQLSEYFRLKYELARQEGFIWFCSSPEEEVSCNQIFDEEEAARQAARQAEEERRQAQYARLEQARLAEEERKAKLKAERERQADGEKAKKAAKEAARLKRQEQIQLRPAVSVDEQGEKLRGIPVVGIEWQALSNDTAAIEVYSYDEVTLRAGRPIKHFIVKKTNGGRAFQAEVKHLAGGQILSPKKLSVTFGQVIAMPGRGKSQPRQDRRTASL